MIRNRIILLIPFLFILSCRTHYLKQNEKFEHFTLSGKEDSSLTNDSLARFKKKVDAETQRVIVLSNGQLTKDGAETTLGNFVCDALKYSAQSVFPDQQADIVIVNRGGLRANLPKGEIKVQNVFELMPFENEMVQIKITGAALAPFFDMLTDKKHAFSGMTVKLRNKKVVTITIGGIPLDSAKVYNLITSDYLANGGDNFFFLQKNVSIQNSGIKIRDAIISYCENKNALNQTLNPYKDGRLEISE